MRKGRFTLGNAVDECIKRSTEEWFRQHQGYRSREEAACNDVRLLSATVERRPGGRCTVHIGIVTHDRRSTTSDQYKYHLEEGLGYVEDAHSKSKR